MGAELFGLIGLAASVAVVGGLIPGTAYAGASGRLRPNALVGVRTKATLASDAAWRAGHRVMVPFGQAVAVLGAAGIALMLLLTPLWGGTAGILAGMVALLCQAGLTIAALGPVDRAARRAHGEA